jgi:hypothetical protein
MPRTSTIAVYRSNDIWMDRNRVYKVVVDGETSGEIWPNQLGTYSVTPGEHRVQVRIDFMKSNEMSVSLDDGQTLELTCSGRGSAWAFLHTVFRRNAYLSLQSKTPS